MGIFQRRRANLNPVIEAAITGPTFDVVDTFDPSLVDVPPELLGLPGGVALNTSPVARVSRREAMQVPAFRRATDLVSTLGTLPINTVKSDYTVRPNTWLRQPERDVPRAVTMSRLVVDLAHEGIAWWKVTAFDWSGYPAEVIRLDPRTVDVLPEGRVKVTTNGKRGMAVEWPTDAELIRFEMPGAGWLTDGARAIRQCLILDAAAQRYAEGAPPGDYFAPSDPSFDPFEDSTEVRTKLLDPWHAARQARSTAYVPPAVTYHSNPFNPENLELADQRQHAVLEIARVTGIDPEELGVSTTSRSYSNQFDRRKQFTDFTLGLFRSVIEGRLSMPDISINGDEVMFDLDGFMRSDAKSRYEAYAAGLAVGAIADKAEVRETERKPALPTSSVGAVPAPAAPTDPTPAPVPAEEVTV